MSHGKAHLVVIAIEQCQEARLRSRSAFDPTEAQIVPSPVVTGEVCAAEREKETEKEPTKDPLVRRGRAGVGGRPTSGPGAGLLQLCSPTSYMLLRFSSSRPSCSSRALRGELCQTTPYQASWHLPMSAHPPP